MKKLFTAAAAVALASAMSVSAFAADKLKVGFIYIGPPGDHGWTYQHDQGRLAVEAKLGDKVETVFVENVPEGPDAERTITRLARQGAGLIYTTSFGYMDPTLKVAKKFPDVKFEHAAGSSVPTTWLLILLVSMKVVMLSVRSPPRCRSLVLPVTLLLSQFQKLYVVLTLSYWVHNLSIQTSN